MINTLFLLALVLAPCISVGVSASGSPCSKGHEAARADGWLCSSAAGSHIAKRSPLRALDGILTVARTLPVAEGVPELTFFTILSNEGPMVNLNVADLEYEILRTHEQDRFVESVVVDEGGSGPSLHAIRFGNAVSRSVMTSNIPRNGFMSANYTRTSDIHFNVLVLRSSFANQTLSSTCTAAYVQDFMGNMSATRSTAKTYGQSALGRVYTSVTVSSSVQTISYNGGTGGTCYSGTTPYDWFDAVKTAHSGSYNYTAYDLVIAILPYPSGCSYGGIATVGNGCGQGGCSLNLNLECTYRVLAHETGHNLGWRHSGDKSYEYGDSSCLMGSTAASLNVLKRFQKGFLPSTAIDFQVQSKLPYLSVLQSIDNVVDESQITDKLGLMLDVPNDVNPWFISYRTKEGNAYDLPSKYCGVNVHYFTTTTYVSIFNATATAAGNFTSQSPANFTEVRLSDGTTIRTVATGCSPGSKAGVLVYQGSVPEGYSFFNCANGCPDSGFLTSSSQCYDPNNQPVDSSFCLLTGSVTDVQTKPCDSSCVGKVNSASSSTTGLSSFSASSSAAGLSAFW